MRISVTAGHIARGNRRDGESCPLVRAIREALGRPVFLSGRYVWEPGWLVGHIEEAAYARLRRYDRNLPMEPFEFELTLLVEEERSPTG